MDERLARETEGLIKSWERHEECLLRDYLVAGVEDPRINIQSILTRHFLIEKMFGSRFAALMDQELRFALVMNWLLNEQKTAASIEDWPPILHALEQGADNAEGLPIPHFVSQTFAALPGTFDEVTVPNYLRDGLSQIAAPLDSRSSGSVSLAIFEEIWRRALENEPVQGLTVLEPACGSANDYRFLDGFGLARLLDYTGFDLSEKNVRNAREMFPGVRFEVGNVFQIGAADRAFEVCFVHDLFEHFSMAGLEAALAELCRVTRQGLCVGFFSMHEGEDHVVRPLAEYHWNTLSMARTRALFERHGFSVQVIHVGAFLKWRFGCEETHNQNAYTFVAARAEL